MTLDPVLSVCIPSYRRPAAIVREAVESALRAMPDNAELLVLPSGPEACSEVRKIALPAEVRIEESTPELSFVENLNRCLNLSEGDLIHILHDDDAVAPDFYKAILGLHRRFPQAALYATGTMPLELKGETSASHSTHEPFFLQGDDAAAFILADERYSVPSVVLTRRVIERQGLFRDDFAYSPDEEAYPRYAGDGGFAVDPRTLYRARTHSEQARVTASREPDFVASYLRSRVEGAASFTPAVRELALRSSARRVISASVSLTLNGEHVVALHQLDVLGEVVPSCRRWPRFWLSRGAGRFRLVRGVVGLRRQLTHT